jgi:hypothetical protein
MNTIEKLFLVGILLLAALGKMYNSAGAEELTTNNLVPTMSEFATAGSTSFGTGSGCSSGAYCTSGTSGGGGTYTSSFDVPLTQDEVRQGFTLNSGITINSHPSNSMLATCENITQSRDCRDIFRLSITLSDGDTAVESFSHQEELDFSGLRNFTFSDVVAANDYGVLTGVYELFGIDAGFPSGFFGPQFSSPSLTIDYQTALVQEEVLATISDQLETETQDIIAETVAPEAEPVAVATLVETTPALPTLTTSTITTPTVEAPPPAVAVPVVTDTATSVSSIPPPSVAPPPPEAPTAPVIEPIAPSSQTQQAEEFSAEAEIEAAVETPIEAPVEAPSEVAVEAPAETVAETPTETTSSPQEETSADAPTEPVEETPSEAPTETVEETPAEAPTEVAESTPTESASEETTTESSAPEKTEAKAEGKSKSASRRKAASTASSDTTTVSSAVPVTPAMAAQAVVDAIAPSQKYGSAAQTTTLVAMGVIAQNKALFKGRGIPDASVRFFSPMAVPDGPSMVDRMQNYRILGYANSIHQQLIESQWSK